MIKVTDELLNQYIDGELDSASLKELKQILETDSEALAKLKSLKLVDENLHNLEAEKAPVNFAERVINVIFGQVKKAKPKVNHFFVTMFSLFAIAILAVVGIAFNVTSKQSGSSTVLETYKNKVEEFINNSAAPLQSILKGNSIMYVGIALSVILLIAMYFLFESHKNFKNKLGGYSR